MKTSKKIKIEEKPWGNHIFFYCLDRKIMIERDIRHPQYIDNKVLEATKILVKYDGNAKEFYIMKVDAGHWPGQKEAIGKSLMGNLEYNYNWTEMSGGEFFVALL